MKRRNNRAYHDFGQPKEPEPAVNSPYDPPNYWEETDDVSVLPEQQSINARLASLHVRPEAAAKKLVDRIPGPQLPSTLGLNGSSREPIPEIPEERLLAQAAVDEGNSGLFRTFEDTCPPPADVEYSVVDQGISGPNFIRCSMYNVPYTDKLKRQTQLPLAVYMRPFAEPEVPLADFTDFDGEEMPPRCHRCRAYMNASMRFVSGGAKFVCNLCLFVNSTPAEYFQPTGPDGRRLDWETRPELAFGTYDFAVVKPRQAQGQGEGAEDGQGETPHPQPAEAVPSADAVPSVYGQPADAVFQRVFICECSRDAVQKEVVALFADAVRACLPHLAANERVAIITFDSHIHMFRPTMGNSVQMLVEAADSAVMPPDVFMAPSSPVLAKLLDDLPHFFADTNDRSSCFGSALDVISQLPEGGRVTVLLSTLPSIGAGLLRMRDNAIAGITPPDAPVHKELFEPTSSFYKSLASRFVTNGWGCDVLAVPTTGYLDLANIGQVAKKSGGQVFFYPRFVPARDSRKVVADLLAITSGALQARHVSLRIRSSNGLQVEHTYGSDTAAFMDGNSTVVATVAYDGNLDPKLDAHFQAAILYTTPLGERRVRVLNLVAGVTTKLKSVLKFVDTDVIMAVLTRQTLAQLGQHSTRELRLAVLDKLERVFGAARYYTGQGIPLTQLLMPTNFRQLLMLGLALTKSVALGSRAFSSDARVVNALYLHNATPNELALALYPRIYDVGSLSSTQSAVDSAAAVDGTAEPGVAVADLPSSATVRARFTDLLIGSRAFLVCDGQQFYLWLGESVRSSVLTDLFGVSDLSSVSPWLDELPARENPVSISARALCASLATRVGRSWLPLQIVREKLDGAEYQLRQLMVEDTINDSPSYINYVVKVHNIAKEYREKEGWF